MSKYISQEEQQLFRQSVGKVKRITSDKLHLRPKDTSRVLRQPQESRESNAIHMPTTQVDSNDTLRFISPGIRKDVLKKLENGFFGIDAELDLHGLNTHKAHQTFHNFIGGCIQDGLYSIHIIHGKGYRSADRPILKNELNHWLRLHPEVLAFCSSRSDEGGTGAVYVLLAIK